MCWNRDAKGSGKKLDWLKLKRNEGINLMKKYDREKRMG